MKRSTRRVLAVIPALLLQCAWLFILTRWLAPFAGLISFTLSVLSLIFVLYVATKLDESTYQILWLIVILAFPLPGTLLYLIVGNKRTTRPLRKRLQASSAAQEGSAWEYPSDMPLRVAESFDSVRKITGSVPCRNRGTVYYPLGEKMFEAMLADLRRARKFIFVEYFILEDGVMWDAMVEIMARKVEEGVDVRVMYDDVGSLSSWSPREAASLRRRGIKCVPFNPLLFVSGTLNYRDHRKLLIIDGEAAFSGGVNLADEYINKKEKYGHWKDIGYRIAGEAVREHTKMFVEFWNAFSPEKIPAALVEPMPLPPEENHDGYVLSYYDSPLRAQAASNELYIDLLSQAERRAWFYTPYLLPGDALLSSFLRTARRGVDVRIIMPGIPDKKFIYRMSHSFYRPLLEAGVKIYEYAPGFVHAKGCVVDDVIGTVGTVNLDYRSLFLHFENNSLFYRASLLDDLRSDFEQTQALCREVRLEDLRSGFLNWLVDGFLRIIAPLC